jgi:predicted RNase H-like nuclease (RuvC/YqgF family)
MKDDLLIEKKIARYEEEIEWLQKKLKQSQDNLFCAKAELQKLNDKL